MSYIIYGEDGSGSFAPEAMLTEVGAPFERRTIELSKDEQLDDEYKAVNPMGRIPALVLPDGTLVTESAAILLTLDARHAAAGLMPAPGTRDHAIALRWLMFISNNIYEGVGRVDYPGRYTSNWGERESVKNAALSELRFHWMLVERALPGGDHAVGGRFSLLDLYIANLSGWFVPREWREANCPRIEAIRAAVAARPKLAPLWARHFKRDDS